MTEREENIKIIYAFSDAKKAGKHWFSCPLCNGDAVWRKTGEGTGGDSYAIRCLNCDFVSEILELKESEGVECD